MNSFILTIEVRRLISCFRSRFGFQFLVLSLFSFVPAGAQPATPIVPTSVTTVDSLPLRDLSAIGAAPALGTRFQVDLPDGTSCISNNGTPPSLNFFSGYSHRQDESRSAIDLVNRYTGNGNGYAVGAVLNLPFKTMNSRNCDEAYALNVANKKLEMATFMFQEDLLSEQELRSLAAELKKVLLPIK